MSIASQFSARVLLIAAGCVWVLGSLSGCKTSSLELVGTPRAPVNLDQVRLYLEPPPAPYEQIALIGASSGRSLALTSDAKAEIVIRRLREEAAKLGANGVLLYGISDEATIFLGTDIGTDHQGPRGTIDLGIGGGGFWHRQSGRGVAIYLTPDLNQHASQ